MTRHAPGNRSVIVGDSNSQIFMTGRSQLNATAPSIVYRDAGSSILYGTPVTDTLINTAARILNDSGVSGATVQAALNTLNLGLPAAPSGNNKYWRLKSDGSGVLSWEEYTP
jgi:hypothetical protein